MWCVWLMWPLLFQEPGAVLQDEVRLAMGADALAPTGTLLLVEYRQNLYRRRISGGRSYLLDLEGPRWLVGHHDHGAAWIGFDGAAEWRREYSGKQLPFTPKPTPLEACIDQWYSYLPLLLDKMLTWTRLPDEAPYRRARIDRGDRPLAEVWIDDQGLLRKLRTYNEGEPSPFTVWHYEDYREVLGMYLPFCRIAEGRLPATVVLSGINYVPDRPKIFDPWPIPGPRVMPWEYKEQ